MISCLTMQGMIYVCEMNLVCADLLGQVAQHLGSISASANAPGAVCYSPTSFHILSRFELRWRGMSLLLRQINDVVSMA